MGVYRACDVCKLHDIDANRVDRYQLRLYTPRKREEPGLTPHNAKQPRQGRFESAGSIDLCRKCWGRIGEPRMRGHGHVRERRAAP